MNPTEGMVGVDEGCADFRAITLLRGGQAPIVGRNFKALVPVAERDEARAKFGDMGSLGMGDAA
jgi:hypothetical protein